MAGRVRTAIFSVAAAMVLSKALGFLREIVIARQFGTSPEYDLYLVAVMVPALVYGMISYACFYLFVPHLTHRMTPDGSGEIDLKRVWPTVNLTLAAALVVAALIWLLAPLYMQLWSRDFPAESFATIVFYCRLTAIMVVLGTSEAFMRAFLNVKRVYAYPAASFAVFNLVLILAVVLFSKSLSIGALALGLLGGLFLQNVYLFLRVLGFHPLAWFTLRLGGPEARAFLATAGLLVLVDLLNRSYVMIDRYFAPGFGDGVVSALYYAYVIVQMPDAVIGLAVGTVAFPLLSAAFDTEQHRSFAAVYRKTVEYCLLISAPLAVFLFANAETVVRLVFERGVFDASSTEMTAALLKAYIPSIVALFLISTSIRAGYSAGLAPWVLLLAAGALILKAAGMMVLPGMMGYPGLAAATAVSHVVYGVALVILVMTRTGIPDRGPFVWVMARMLLAAAVVWPLLLVIDGWLGEAGFPSGTSGDLIRLITSGLATAVLYTVLLGLAGLSNYVRDIFRLREARV